jgi:hypothetical protein
MIECLSESHVLVLDVKIIYYFDQSNHDLVCFLLWFFPSHRQFAYFVTKIRNILTETFEIAEIGDLRGTSSTPKSPFSKDGSSKANFNKGWFQLGF